MAPDDGGGEIYPGDAGIQNRGVAGSDGGGRALEEAVGIHVKLDGPGPALISGHGGEKGPQPAAVGDGLIKQPGDGGDLMAGEKTADGKNSGFRFLNEPVGAVDSGKIPQAAVTSADEHTSPKGSLQGDEKVESIHGDGGSVKSFCGSL